MLKFILKLNFTISKVTSSCKHITVELLVLACVCRHNYTFLKAGVQSRQKGTPTQFKEDMALNTVFHIHKYEKYYVQVY